jgi:uncharacterized protein (TIGR00251 family)
MVPPAIKLRSSTEGIVLPVHALPGSRRNALGGVHDGRLKVAVTQAAEKGKANREIIKLLAAAFKLPKSKVQLIAGETSSRKEILLVEQTASTIAARLAEILQQC